MAAYLGNIGDIVSAAVGWMATAADAIVANPLALMFILLPMLGVGISLFARIIHLN